MRERIAQWQPDQSAAVAARAVAALTLVALAVIHVLDLPGTLGPTPIVGIGYLGIIVSAILIGGVLIARPHWLSLHNRTDAGAHRTEVNGHMRRVGDQAPVVVEERAGVIEALLDVH